MITVMSKLLISSKVLQLHNFSLIVEKISNFEQIFVPQGSTRVSYAIGFGELWPTFE